LAFGLYTLPLELSWKPGLGGIRGDFLLKLFYSLMGNTGKVNGDKCGNGAGPFFSYFIVNNFDMIRECCSLIIQKDWDLKMPISCAEYRETQLLLAIKKRLAEEKLEPVEQKELEALIRKLEEKLGL
jgi:hypothetical protein